MGKLEEITSDPVYKQVIADSFGGVMYNVANRNKYDSEEIVSKWESLSAGEQEAAGGIVKGAMNFLGGN